MILGRRPFAWLVLTLTLGLPAAALADPAALWAALRDPVLRPVDQFRLRQGWAEPRTPDGAIGAAALWVQGKAKAFYLDEQRRGTDFFLQPSLALGETAGLAPGISTIDFGFSQMGPDGSFSHIPDVTHATEFFLEGAARALLLLDAAHSPLAPATGARWRPQLSKLADWFLRPEIAEGHPDRDLHPFTHRYYARAAGLAEAAVVLGRPDLARAADHYAREGVARQRADGVNPERGGFDIGYQVAGLLYAEYYAFLCADPQLKQSVAAMSGRALDFLGTRTDAGGAVAAEGSTRVGKEKDREGVTKKINYAAYAQVLVLGSKLTGRPEFEATAITVMQTQVEGHAP